MEVIIVGLSPTSAGDNSGAEGALMSSSGWDESTRLHSGRDQHRRKEAVVRLAPQPCVKTCHIMLGKTLSHPGDQTRLGMQQVTMCSEY